MGGYGRISGWNGERTEDVFRRCGTCEVLGEKLRNGDGVNRHSCIRCGGHIFHFQPGNSIPVNRDNILRSFSSRWSGLEYTCTYLVP
jgi:predicted RNA-binding Zn-ribbon protein involved in translation (DUF1610 family)